MQRTEIDGVPVFWQQGPEPLAAELIFRVGMRDEAFARRGITHLIEHLAMSRLGRRHHEHNASVSVAVTTFEASGRPEPVAAFLADVCAALADLPVDRIDTERKVHAAEHGGEDGGPVGDHLLMRYGLTGPGLVGAPAPAADEIDAGQVREWAARWFVRSNAALVLTGPPPAGLRLPLPDGPRPDRAAARPLPLDGPVWDSHPGDRGVALSLLAPADEAMLAATRIARERVTDELRHARGLAYDVDVVPVRATAAECVVILLADPAAAAVPDAVTVLDSVLRDLRDTGPTDAELAEDLAACRERWADPRAVVDDLAEVALAHLAGRVVDPAAQRAEREALTAAGVRAALAGYPGSAILTVPEGIEPAGFRPYPVLSGDRVTGRVFKRQPFGPVPRGAALVVGDDGVSLLLKDGPVTVRWSEVVGYGRHEPGFSTLYGADGITLDLHPGFFRRGGEALELIEARVPAGLRFTEQPPPEPPR